MKKKVSEYMSTQITYLEPDDNINKFVEKLNETGHSGYPVCKNNRLEGYVTSKNFILSNGNTISDISYDDRPSIEDDCSLNRASRIMSRNRIHEIPVVDDERNLIGIISNLDIIRSEIEKTQIEKVDKIVKMYEDLYDTNCNLKQDSVSISDLNPTQDTVYKDELNARQYEVINNLIEPIVVIKSDGLAILDGHHRVLAAENEGIDSLEAYIIEPETDQIEILENARKTGIQDFDDIKIKD